MLSDPSQQDSLPKRAARAVDYEMKDGSRKFGLKTKLKAPSRATELMRKDGAIIDEFRRPVKWPRFYQHLADGEFSKHSHVC